MQEFEAYIPLLVCPYSTNDIPMECANFVSSFSSEGILIANANVFPIRTTHDILWF